MCPGSAPLHRSNNCAVKESETDEDIENKLPTLLSIGYFWLCFSDPSHTTLMP